jgi:hypothetical protein
MLGSVGLAWTTYLCVERPIRRGSNKAKTAAGLFAVILAIGAVGFAIWANRGFEGRPGIAQFEKAHAQFVGPLWQFSTNKDCLQRFPVPGGEQYHHWYCMVSSPAPPTVVVLGNSYANHLYPGLVQALPHQTVLSIGICGAQSIEPSTWGPDQWSPCGRRAYEDQVAIDRFIAQSKSLRFAVLAGLAITDSKEYAEVSKEYAEGVIRRIDFLEANGIKVIVFVPQIVLPFDIRRCFPRPLGDVPTDCNVPLSVRDKINVRFKPVIEAVRAQRPEVKVFDINDVFCNSTACSFKRDGMPLYRDEWNHLSEYGSIEVGKVFATWAKQNEPEILSPD